MFLILAQFLSELLLTMCKVYQDFYNKTVYTNKIIGLICAINLLKPSRILKFNTFIHNLTTFHFHSFHPTPMHLLDFCLVLRFVVVLLYQSRGSIKSCIQLKQSNTTTMSFFNQFQSTKHTATIDQFDPGSWFLNYLN